MIRAPEEVSGGSNRVPYRMSATRKSLHAENIYGMWDGETLGMVLKGLRLRNTHHDHLYQ